MEENATLRNELQIGLDQLKEGKSVVMTDDLWAEIRNKAKAELEAEQNL
jgi:hypothetical protein